MKNFLESFISLGKFLCRLVRNQSWWPFIFAIALVAGCKYGNYVEGTSTSLGLYIPTTDGIFGVQVLEYLNGVKVTTATNQPFKITRTHYATNNYFGVVKTIENTKTEVEVGAAAAPLALEVMKPQNYIWDTWTLDDVVHTNDIRRIQK